MQICAAFQKENIVAYLQIDQPIITEYVGSFKGKTGKNEKFINWSQCACFRAAAPDLPRNGTDKRKIDIFKRTLYIGFVLAAAYVVLDYLLVPRVRTEMDVQKHLGMMLLGTVSTGKEKKGNG